MADTLPGKEFARLHAEVEGHVQGVGFRYFVQQRAVELGLTGWVRNLWSGNVEVVAEGERPSLEKLLDLLHRGPRSSYVTGVKVDWSAHEAEFKGFQVRMTA